MEFTYKAIQNGKTINGTVDAETHDKALSYLKNSNITVLELSEKSSAVSSGLSKLTSRVSFSNIVDFTRQFSIMLNSGLTLIDSLDILKRQSDNPAFLKLIQEIDADVKAGMNFSDALKKHPNQFSNLYLALVKAGEASGKLDEIMMKLAENMERQRTFKGKIKGAMIYPAIVITAMLGVMLVMITFVIPQLLTVYEDFDVELPVATRILIVLSDFFQNWWWGVFALIIVGVFSLLKFYRSEVGKKIIDSFMLRLPLINRIVKVAALVDTTRTLSILIASGVSILEALDIVTETTNNKVYQEAFINIRHAIERGEPLGAALDQTRIFPPILVQMTSVGEQTGHLDETLGHLANYFEAESEVAIKALTTLIEPAILVVLGAGVGFVVIAVITPIFNLTSSF